MTSPTRTDLISEPLLRDIARSQAGTACDHQRIVEDKATWIETCRDCSAWRDRAGGPESAWFWREPESFRRLSQPPDIGPDVPGGGAI